MNEMADTRDESARESLSRDGPPPASDEARLAMLRDVKRMSVGERIARSRAGRV